MNVTRFSIKNYAWRLKRQFTQKRIFYNYLLALMLFSDLLSSVEHNKYIYFFALSHSITKGTGAIKLPKVEKSTINVQKNISNVQKNISNGVFMFFSKLESLLK